MAIFSLDEPVITKEPAVSVDNELRPGTYEFRLVVENSRRQRSRPTRQRVQVLNVSDGDIGLRPGDLGPETDADSPTEVPPSG